jgi:hypothetical protein
MATTDLRIDIASEFTGAKAFRDADSAAAKLERTVKNLAKAVGVGLTVQAVGRFGKDSLKAFLDDEAAANRLSLAVKNLGMEFANPYIANYINQLEQTAKVADDELRPAFQSLLQQTGSLSKAQSLLNTAIETSRGSTYDLGTVANDLAQAYVGNTKGLKKYYLGLDNATLKAKSFTEIQEIMNKQFSGSNTAYLSTYSGQVGVLSLAWGNFQEKVGGTLLTLASFGDGSEGAKLNLLAATLDKIGSAIELIGKGKESIFGLFNITGKNGLLSKFNPYQVSSGKEDETSVKGLTKYEKQLAKIEEDRKKLNAQLTKDKKNQLALDKAKAALAKSQANFDITKISLAAALKGKVSVDEENRLKALQAIENGNGQEALSWIAKIDAARKKAAEDELTRQQNIATYTKAQGYAAGLLVQQGSAAISAQVSELLGNKLTGYEAGIIIQQKSMEMSNTISSLLGSLGNQNSTNVNLTVSATDEFTSALRYELLDSSLSGKQAAISRNLGSF